MTTSLNNDHNKMHQQNKNKTLCAKHDEIYAIRILKNQDFLHIVVVSDKTFYILKHTLVNNLTKHDYRKRMRSVILKRKRE